MKKAAGFLCVLGASVALGMTSSQAAEWGWLFSYRGHNIPTTIKGNDTGGIIPWSPATEAKAHDLSAAHCEKYGKYTRITAVHREYGDYISFNCLWDPRMARYALPEVHSNSRR